MNTVSDLLIQKMQWGIELYVFAIVAIILIVIIHLRHVLSNDQYVDPYDIVENQFAKWKDVEGFVASIANSGDQHIAPIATASSPNTWHVGQLDQRLQHILAMEEPKTYTFVSGNKQFLLHSAIREAIAKLRSTTATQLTADEMDVLLAPIVRAYREVGSRSDAEIDDVLGYPATRGSTVTSVNQLATSL